VNLTTLPIENSLVLASTLVSAVIGLLVALRRGHWLTTLLFSAAFFAVAAFQAGTLGVLHAESAESARNWAIYLGRTSALASWLWLALTVALARRDPWDQIRNAGAYLTLALVGSIAMSFVAGSPQVLRGVVGRGSPAEIVLGPLGKVYLMYLIIAMLAMLMNLERMLRNTQANAMRRLRPMYVALAFAILTELIVISGALMSGGLKVSWLVASAPPLFVTGVATALSLARRRLSDLTVPVARPVIYYSSVSLTLAAAFLLATGVLSKVLPTLSPAGRRVVTFAFCTLAGGGGLMLVLSPRANRTIRRFIDRNFYANRYDYRREWERVSGAITPTAHSEDIARQIEGLIRTVFDAERVAIYMRREAGSARRAIRSSASMGPIRCRPSSTATTRWSRTSSVRASRSCSARRRSISISCRPPPRTSRRSARLGAAVVRAAHGRRAARRPHVAVGAAHREPYSSEDIAFLEAMARQLAAALWFARIASSSPRRASSTR
jgi:hypothetical protein